MCKKSKTKKEKETQIDERRRLCARWCVFAFSLRGAAGAAEQGINSPAAPALLMMTFEKRTTYDDV